MFGSLIVLATILAGIYAVVLTVIGFKQGKYIGRSFEVTRAETPALFLFFNIGQFFVGALAVVAMIVILCRQR
jgi:hypothetical protein